MKKNCVFCSNAFIKKRTVEKTNNIFVAYDKNPVTRFHLLFIIKKHKKSFFDLSESELKDLFFLLKKMKKKIMIKDKSIKGFNLGVNLGKLSGQTILHCHFHLIPRRKNDRDLRLNKGGFFWIK